MSRPVKSYIYTSQYGTRKGGDGGYVAVSTKADE